METETPKKTAIYKAIEVLPEELITDEIAVAAISEGNVSLFDHLPQKYLTSEAILSIINTNDGKISLLKHLPPQHLTLEIILSIIKFNENNSHSFELDTIPEPLRSEEVCEFAVKRSKLNIIAVPKELRSSTMLKQILSSTKNNIGYLHLFDESVWNMELVHKAIASVYSETTSNYSSRRGYSDSTTRTYIERVFIILSYIPKRLKKKAYYLGLFENKITPEDIDVMTPDRYKDKAYYVKMASKKFKLVPPHFYGYDVFMSAIASDRISLGSPYIAYNKSRIETAEIELKHKKTIDKLFEVMDDEMADKIIAVNPKKFVKLPEIFQTSKRLLDAIKLEKDDIIINNSDYAHLLTKDVCKAYIYRNNDLPTFPASIWTEEFVDCCIAYGTSNEWFEQMPSSLQTLNMVEKILKHRGSQIKYVRTELISPEQAQRIYRTYEHSKEHVPQHYINDFKIETGLDEKFYGGEMCYDSIREYRNENTYCQLGHCYIGISCESKHITMTRRTPQSVRPEVVFEEYVSTFHTTWLEKLIADNDNTYVKPTVTKALKPLQVNGYYKLEKVCKYEGETIYANSLLGERVYFTVSIGGKVIKGDSLEEIKEHLTPEEVDAKKVVDDKAA